MKHAFAIRNMNASIPFQKIRRCYDQVDHDKVKLTDASRCTHMALARELAKNSTMLQRHGCVIVYKNQVLTKTVNTKPSGFNSSSHAEINAIKSIKGFPHISQCDMYVARIGTDGMCAPLRYSKPCARCTALIKWYKIRRVYYSVNE